jgi:hypothetical protein
MKAAVRYGDKVTMPRVKIGDGIVGYAALHKKVILVPDVSADPRYIKVVDDARSELVIPLMLKERCIGVFDLESPELDAFSKSHIEILTLLASQAAVAIENARLRTIRRNEKRLEKKFDSRSGFRARCRPICPSGSKSMSRRGSNRRASWEGSPGFLARIKQPSWPSVTCQAKAWQRHSTSIRRHWSARARSAAATHPSDSARRAYWRR